MAACQVSAASQLSALHGAMRTLTKYILLVLFTVAPILSVTIASAVASHFGGKLDEGGPHPCIIHGVDVGGTLYSMFVAGWLMLLTLPIGFLAILMFTLKLLQARLRNRRRDAA